MTALQPTTPAAGTPRVRRHWGGPVVGCFFLFTSGVHLGIVAADTGFYRPFADEALFAFVRDGWRDEPRGKGGAGSSRVDGAGRGRVLRSPRFASSPGTHREDST